MLARNAEALYWIGRYVERADDTARILDVTVHQLLEDSSVLLPVLAGFSSLLQVLGIEPPKHQLDLWSLTDLVAFSRGLQGGCSIVDAISAARENARSAREVTSSDMWECLNTTYNALAERERAARRLGPHEFFSFIEGRAARVQAGDVPLGFLGEIAPRVLDQWKIHTPAAALELELGALRARARV